MTGRTGLRERKKAETRAALSLAAMRLATEHGLEGVTAEAIAAAADVSLRTFHNYFRNKDEAILGPYRMLVSAAVDELRARPGEEAALDSLEHICARLVSGAIALPDEVAAMAERLWMSPRMAAHRPTLVVELIRPLASVIAERTGQQESALYPQLVAASAAATLLTVFGSDEALTADPAGRLRVLHEAFALLRSGLRAPAQRRPRASAKAVADP